MLVQLEKVVGVDSAMANKSGDLVRVSLKGDADAGKVATELEAILAKEGRKPKQLDGDAVAKTIQDEEWRPTERIGELSEIEFRTVFAKRVKEFTKSSEFDEATASKLLAFSEEILEATPASNQDTGWKDFCGGLTSRMLEKAKEVLSEEQLKELAKKLKARVIG